MNFTSQTAQPENAGDEDDVFGGDVLDDVYSGGGDKGNKSKKPAGPKQPAPAPKSALTMNEMIKISHNLLAELLKNSNSSTKEK